MTDVPRNEKAGRMTENHAECDVDIKVQERFFSDHYKGVFLEIGAARPDYLSVSAHYRSRNWKVIAIEPNPAYKPLYEEFGYEVLQYACGDRDEDDVPFSVVNSHGSSYRGGQVSFESFSSLGVKDIYGGQRELDITNISVKLRRLDTILSQHAPEVTQVDIVCVDIEGWELEALSGLDFGKYNPQVLIVENLFHEARYRTFMRMRGYRLWKRLGPNDVYAKSSILRPSELITSPAQHLGKTVVGRTRSALRSYWKRWKRVKNTTKVR